jgi:hypothetical protein
MLLLMSVWEVLQRQHFLKTYVMKQYTSRRLGQRNSYKLVKLHIVYFILSQAYADASRIRVHRCSCKFATTSKKIRTYICCISSRMIRLGYPGRQQDLNWDFNKEVHKFNLPERLISGGEYNTPKSTSYLSTSQMLQIQFSASVQFSTTYQQYEFEHKFECELNKNC